LLTPFFLDGYQGSFQRVRRQWRDANHSPPSIAEVKNEWSYTFTLLCALAWTGTTLAFLNGMNELHVDGLVELSWIVELLEVRTRASVCSKVDRFYDSER
jgi:hypothetical protein